MLALWQWLLENRRWFGSGLMAVFVYLQANPVTSSRWFSIVIGVIGSFLSGAGFIKSDEYHKDNPKT